MQKDFDNWNKHKQKINMLNKHPYFHEREIRWCYLGLNVGFEQNGTGHQYERPVLIIKAFSKEVCLILPLTTSKKKNIYHISLGTVAEKEAFVIISQIRLIDTKRLQDRLIFLNKEKFDEIRKATRNLI